MKSQKKKKKESNPPPKKKMKTKYFQNSNISELNQCECQTMSVLDNVSVRQCQDIVNVRLR